MRRATRDWLEAMGAKLDRLDCAMGDLRHLDVAKLRQDLDRANKDLAALKEENNVLRARIAAPDVAALAERAESQYAEHVAAADKLARMFGLPRIANAMEDV